MIILDTHIWFWWINEDYKRLDPSRRVLLNDSERVAISVVSCFEIAWLDRHGRLSLSPNRKIWLERALNDSGIELLSLSPKIAESAVELPEHHRDPMDRIIIATALANDSYLMSDDGKFKMYVELAGKLL